MSGSRMVICPGQGAQAVGMGKMWAEKSPEAAAVFERADRAMGTRLGAKLSTLCFEGPVERLNQTDVSQPAIYVTGIACWRGLLASWGAGAEAGAAEAGVVAAAGLSLGEYTALHLAGTFSFEDGLELVTLRGRAMQDAAEASAGGMVALIGADEAQAKQVCEEARGGDVLVCANFNAPGQIVLSGHKEACNRAAEVAGKLGLRASVLAVAGAFHSPLMAPAADRLRAALASTVMQPPRRPVYSNVTARPHGFEVGGAERGGDGATGGTSANTIVDGIRRLLVEQLGCPVRWAECCTAMAGGHPGVGFEELAPGRTLAGLMRRIERSAKVETHDEP